MMPKTQHCLASALAWEHSSLWGRVASLDTSAAWQRSESSLGWPSISWHLLTASVIDAQREQLQDLPLCSGEEMKRGEMDEFGFCSRSFQTGSLGRFRCHWFDDIWIIWLITSFNFWWDVYVHLVDWCTSKMWFFQTLLFKPSICLQVKVTVVTEITG